MSSVGMSKTRETT